MKPEVATFGGWIITLSRIFRGLYVIGGNLKSLYLHASILGRSGLQSRIGYIYLYLEHDIKKQLSNQLSLLLEVRKLLKLLGVAYLEGHLKSRSYSN